jgi:hypothetical protein
MFIETNGKTYEVGSSPRYHLTTKRDEDGNASRETGLGTFRVGAYEFDETLNHPFWIYIAPNGTEFPTHKYLKSFPAPPPLPQPDPKRAHCRCGPHICGYCGQPYWIELHGNADGYCTYCYAGG